MDLSPGHNEANKSPDIPLRSGFDKMPSLLRFLVVVGALAGLVSGGLYVLANQFEPAQQEVTKPVPSVKIRRQ
jgi:cobalamin synthase